MSLLKDVLRKKAASNGTEPPGDLSISSRKTFKKYAASIRSSSGASIRSVRSVAESIASFYSTLAGGNRVPKRRRADVSRLGVPKWYRRNAPLPPDMPGTEPVEQIGPCTTAHAISLVDYNRPDDPPTTSIVLYSHSPSKTRYAMYFNEAKVQGELRLKFDKPTTLAAIDVWLYGKSESVIKLVGKPLAAFHANLYHSSRGEIFGGLIKDIPTTYSSGIPENGKFPPGTYPFEFPPLPRFVRVELPPEDVNKEGGVAWVPLPPTVIMRRPEGLNYGFEGEITYGVGVNVDYGVSLTPAIELDIPFSYFPRVRPIPREDVPFPFIPSREDWPFQREVIGGWTITPFGGRGRFRDEIIELEGLLGVQTPEVSSPGQSVKFGLLLWSTSIPALDALSHPDSFDVVFSQSQIYGTDSLKPRNSARRNRTLIRLSQGRIWRTDDGPPGDDTMPQLRPAPLTYKAGEATRNGAPSDNSKNPPPTPISPTTPTRRSASSSLQNSFTAEEISETRSSLETPKEAIKPDSESIESPLDGAPSLATVVTDEAGDNKEDPRTPSPTPSLENLDEEDVGERVVRLDGDVMVVSSRSPSFRYENMSNEHIISITITHPDYSHISPSGIGIQTETPIWIVTMPPRGKDDYKPAKAKTDVKTADLSTLAVVGTAVDVGANATRAAKVFGATTTKDRPTWKHQRLSVF